MQLMGAELQGRQGGNYPPLAIKGKKLKGIEYLSPVASAQVKTTIMLAALNADGVTEIWEPENPGTIAKTCWQLWVLPSRLTD